MTIAVLALQGAFAEHEKVLDRLGVSHIELRQAGDLEQVFRCSDPSGRGKHRSGQAIKRA